MSHYVFRAECLADALRFVEMLHHVGRFIETLTVRRVADGYPDMVCTLETDMALEPLRQFAATGEDCHRIAETLYQVA